MMEVELKARLKDRTATETLVASFAVPVREFVKSDSYWHGPDWRTNRGKKGFRIRSDGERHTVTFKSKRTEGGIEINREREFDVSEPGAFFELIDRLGCEPFYEKRKTGKAYRYGEILIEIAEVSSLGPFIEIERLVSDEDPAELALALGEVKSVLAKAGLCEADIESRSYSELILGTVR